MLVEAVRRVDSLRATHYFFFNINLFTERNFFILLQHVMRKQENLIIFVL